MRIEIPYADRTLCADIDSSDVEVLNIRDVAAIDNVDGKVRASIAEPIGIDGPMLGAFKPADTVCIVVPDSFRQAAVDKVLPALTRAIAERGIPDSNVSFLFATGVHRAPTAEEQRTILGAETFERFRGRLVNHDPHNDANMVHVGTTSRGTDVRVNRLVRECDRVIVTGSVMLHYFAGFGGGRKALVPGVASATTIAHNHALNLHPTEDALDPAVAIGVMAGNPVAEDLLEAARFIRTDGIVNTVLNREGKIAGLFVGELERAHAAGCTFARDMFAAEIDEPADIVIAASAHTKNFVQTHKALYNAHAACKASGRIILAAPCREGLGGETFTKWLKLGDPVAVMQALRKQSEINGQTALSTLAKSKQTFFVTELSEDDVTKLGGRKAASLDDAIRAATSELSLNGNGLRVVVMPAAAYTVPFLR